MAAPVKLTCPDIDKVIKHIKCAIRNADHGRKHSDAEPHLIKEFFDDIICELDDLEGTLEDLRKSNDLLRTWGEELTTEVETAANTINELENKLEKL